MLTGSEQMRPTSVIGGEATPEQLAKEWGKEIYVEPLPPSSHLKHRRLPMVIPWEERYAARPDWYANCDVNGNTDPRAWEGTKPETWDAHDKVETPVPEGFKPAEPAMIDSKATPLGEYLADTRAGAIQQDQKTSALPIMIGNAPVSQLMADLQEQMICRWENVT